MKIEERDASDVKHLLFRQQQYITSADFFLPNIYIKTSKLVRTQFELGLRITLKSLRAQPPSTMKQDTEYMTLDLKLLLEEFALTSKYNHQLSLAREDSHSTSINITKVNNTDTRTLAIHS